MAASGNGGKRRVVFSIRAPEASEVFLCGSFNGWDLTRTRMKPDGEGQWRAQVMLVPGTYEYRLRVDGEWINDPEAETVPNPYGTTNCVRVVQPPA